MALIKRSRPALANGTNGTSGAATAKRVVLRRNLANVEEAKKQHKEAARAAVLDQLKLIAKYDAMIDEAVAGNDMAHQEIERLLKDADINDVSDGRYIAELKEAFTRQTTEIDIQKYRKEVSEADFWATVKVQVTEAKKVITDKQLNKVATIVPPKSAGFVLKIERIINKIKK